MLVLKGRPASAGLVTARAFVLTTSSMTDVPEDIPASKYVLVVSHATPLIYPWFRRAVGLVAASGGMTSHAATLAREAGIPAIVGIRELLAVLRSGALIRLDGFTGELTILD